MNPLFALLQHLMQPKTVTRVVNRAPMYQGGQNYVRASYPAVLPKMYDVSAYSLDPGQTDSRPWEGAHNNNLSKMLSNRQKIVASRDLPDGTKVGIGNDIYTVADSMNKRYAGKPNLDILMNSKQEALNFGRQKLPVYIYPKAK